MKQAHVFISGNVQGVGYRYFVEQNASKLGLTGWVGNTGDGGVEAIFQGEQEAIKQMIAFCRKGPVTAQVKQIEFAWETGEETFSEFSIRN